MKAIISGVVVVLGVVAGTLGGHFLRSPAGASDEAVTKDGGHGAADEDETAEAAEQESKDEKKSDKKEDAHAAKSGKDKGGAHGKAGDATGDTVFFQFSREFVVPIMEDRRVKGLIILNISLEAQPSLSDELFSLEPKLRDNIMTSLINLSNDGVTLDNITDVDSYETIRSVILNNLGSVVESGIDNVLIMDIAQQDL